MKDKTIIDLNEIWTINKAPKTPLWLWLLTLLLVGIIIYVIVRLSS